MNANKKTCFGAENLDYLLHFYQSLPERRTFFGNRFPITRSALLYDASCLDSVLNVGSIIFDILPKVFTSNIFEGRPIRKTEASDLQREGIYELHVIRSISEIRWLVYKAPDNNHLRFDLFVKIVPRSYETIQRPLSSDRICGFQKRFESHCYNGRFDHQVVYCIFCSHHFVQTFLQSLISLLICLQLHLSHLYECRFKCECSRSKCNQCGCESLISIKPEIETTYGPIFGAFCQDATDEIIVAQPVFGGRPAKGDHKCEERDDEQRGSGVHVTASAVTRKSARRPFACSTDHPALTDAE